MDPQKEADKHDKERLFEIHHPRTSSDRPGGPICLMCAPVRCPPLWWPSVWYLMALSSPLMAALLKTPYAAPPPPPLLMIKSNFALSLSQIVNNLLLRQANAKGLKMRQSHFLFFFGCRMQNILRCRKNSLQGRVVHKGWQDDHSLRVLWHPTPPATIANFRPWQPSIFSFELLVFQGEAWFFFLWRRPPKGGDVEIAFVERSHKSEAVPVLTWKN